MSFASEYALHSYLFFTLLISSQCTISEFITCRDLKAVCSHHVDITSTEVGTFVTKNSDPGTRARDTDVAPVLALRSCARVGRQEGKTSGARPVSV